MFKKFQNTCELELHGAEFVPERFHVCGVRTLLTIVRPTLPGVGNAKLGCGGRCPNPGLGASVQDGRGGPFENRIAEKDTWGPSSICVEIRHDLFLINLFFLLTFTVICYDC